MNESLNIPAILKGKPQGTKLHDLVRGTDVFLNNVVDGCDKVCCTFVKNGSQKLHYSSKGTLVGFEDGMVILVPSKLMRDWSKFAWKKGDILVSKHGTTEVVFDCFDGDTYETFKGKHALKTIEGEVEYKGESDDGYDFYTENYYLESEDAALNYIHIIEKILGGKLNLKTLEIEKTQPDFKDGDIVFEEGNRNYCSAIGVLKKDEQGCFMFDTFLTKDKVCYNSEYIYLPIRLATEEEKKQFFSALEKDGKAWDAEKKQVVRLLYYCVPWYLSEKVLPLLPDYAGLIVLTENGRLNEVNRAPCLHKQKYTNEELKLCDKFYYAYRNWKLNMERHQTTEEVKRLKDEIAFLKAEYKAVAGCDIIDAF